MWFIILLGCWVQHWRVFAVSNSWYSGMISRLDLRKLPSDLQRSLQSVMLRHFLVAMLRVLAFSIGVGRKFALSADTVTGLQFWTEAVKLSTVLKKWRRTAAAEIFIAQFFSYYLFCRNRIKILNYKSNFPIGKISCKIYSVYKSNIFLLCKR